MFTRNGDKFRVSELEDKLEQANHDHEIALSKANRRFDKMDRDHINRYEELQDDHNRLAGEYERDTDRIVADHALEVDFLNAQHDRELSDATERLGAAQKNNTSQADLAKRQIQLERDSTVFEAERKSFGDVKTAVTNARSEGEAAAEAKYKTGYADGLSDGLRKAAEVGADDRNNMNALANKVVDHHKPAEAPDVFILPQGGGGSAKQQKSDGKKND